MDAYLAAAVQLTSTPDVDANLAAAAEGIARAAGEGARLIGLPENFCFLGPDGEKVARAAEIQRRSEDFLIEQAARFGVRLLGGGYPAPHPGGKVVNRARLVGPDGPVGPDYDKIHLFDVDLPGQSLRESETVAPGDRVVAVDAGEPFGVLALSICYDLRFPELYRRLSGRGAGVLLVPAAFTAFTGRAHWELLLRARAVENTCYVIAPAQCGRHFDRRESYGHAMIVDPWGEVLADAGDHPGVAVAEISPARLHEVRGRIPALRHRRLDVPEAPASG